MMNTPRKNMNGNTNQHEQPNDGGVKTTNIQVCIRVRPMFVGGSNNASGGKKKNDDQMMQGKSKTPSKSRISRFSRTPMSRKKKNNYASLDEDPNHNSPSAAGSSNSNIVAWNVVSHDTVQQSKETQRIKGRTNSYTLDQIYAMESTNADIYHKSVQPLVQASLQGYHASVFAYGQTSTGKTYTMSGTKQSPGIVPLAVADMFQSIKMSSDDSTARNDDYPREYLMRVSYLEIYNEQVIDLLSDSPTQSIRILEAKGEVAVRGLREEVVKSPDQIYKLLQKGQHRRQVGSTNMNQHSSRSHTIVRLCLESKVSSASQKTRVSSLSLVDLAGSESVRLTGSTGDRRKEGQYINKSLMALGQVIYKLSENQKGSTPNQKNNGTQQHIPYRDSKLTRLLQPSLSGNAQITCICTISPEPVHLEESHNTLKFATRAKRIQQRSVQNEVSDQNTLLQEYKIEIEELRQQVAELKSANTTQEDVKELIEAIQKMEELILTANKLQKQDSIMSHNGGGSSSNGGGHHLNDLKTPDSGDLLLTPDFAVDAAINTPMRKNKFDFDEFSRPNNANRVATTPLYEEMHRIQNLLGTVLRKKGSPKTRKHHLPDDDDDDDDDNLLNVTREEEVEELRHQLHQQEVTTSLKSADATFLQSQLQEKDALLLEVSKILEAAEQRQLELETENSQLRKLVEEKDRQLRHQEIQHGMNQTSPRIQRL